MKTYRCELSFTEEIKAKDRWEAKEKFCDILCGLSGGWEADNTYISEVEKEKKNK